MFLTKCCVKLMQETEFFKIDYSSIYATILNVKRSSQFTIKWRGVFTNFVVKLFITD